MKSLAARITCLAILLVLCLALLGRAFHLIPLSVMAEIPNGNSSQEGALAPSAPIQPVSVSVINFAELAAKDAKADSFTALIAASDVRTRALAALCQVVFASNRFLYAP